VGDPAANERTWEEDLPQPVRPVIGGGSPFSFHLREVFGENAEQRFSPQLQEHLYQLWRLAHGVGARVRCEHCGGANEVQEHHARTAYSWDGVGENPNAPLALCASCAEAHHERWDAMWDEYHQGLL
jgi:hypothetical protein